MRADIFYAEIWVGAFEPQGFGFVGKGDHATVVVAQHHNGNIAQAWIEHAFATHEEVVAVDQPCHRRKSEVFPALPRRAPVVLYGVSDNPPHLEAAFGGYENGIERLVGRDEPHHTVGEADSL